MSIQSLCLVCAGIVGWRGGLACSARAGRGKLFCGLSLRDSEGGGLLGFETLCGIE